MRLCSKWNGEKLVMSFEGCVHIEETRLLLWELQTDGRKPKLKI